MLQRTGVYRHRALIGGSPTAALSRAEAHAESMARQARVLERARVGGAMQESRRDLGRRHAPQTNGGGAHVSSCKGVCEQRLQEQEGWRGPARLGHRVWRYTARTRGRRVTLGPGIRVSRSPVRTLPPCEYGFGCIPPAPEAAGRGAGGIDVTRNTVTEIDAKSVVTFAEWGRSRSALRGVAREAVIRHPRPVAGRSACPGRPRPARLVEWACWPRSHPPQIAPLACCCSHLPLSIPPQPSLPSRTPAR